MKKLLLYASMVITGIALCGCELSQQDNSTKDYKFYNKSNFHVSVTPQANSGWSGFGLNPGEDKVLLGIDDLFFTFEPAENVKVGENSDGRIVFINFKEGTVKGPL